MPTKVNQLSRWLLTLFICVFSTCEHAIAADTPQSKVCERSWRIVARYPHDVNSFTQGLVMVNGRLFESIGGYGSSAVQEIDLRSGHAVQRKPLDPRVFGEGLAYIDNHLVQLSWHLGVAFVYDLNLRGLRTMRYPGEGWGLTQWTEGDQQLLVLSDGSSSLRFLDPDNLSEVRRMTVTDQQLPITLLNELESFEGHILANVWRQDRIAQIDPDTGSLVAWIDLSSLRSELNWPRGEPRETDLNGIAVAESGNTLLVTGKRWPALFEIELEPCQ